MKAVLLAIVFGLVASQANSTDLPHGYSWALESPTPNELTYTVKSSEACKVTADEMASLVEGVFIRSRIKPLHSLFFPENYLYLHVGLHCLPSDTANQIYTAKIYFGLQSPSPSVFYDWPYGTFGAGNSSSIQNSLRNSVEKAVTHYIMANFDL